MFRSKAPLVAVVACLAGVVSGSIAAAQATTGATGTTGTTGTTGATGATAPAPTPATVTVNGSGSITVDMNAPTATVQSAYMTALGSALTAAHTKAGALATQVGDTLGAVQSITEQSNDIGVCSNRVMYASSGVAKGKGVPAPASAPSAKHHKKHKSHPKAAARIADVQPQPPTTCMVQADLTVTYAMS